MADKKISEQTEDVTATPESEDIDEKPEESTPESEDTVGSEHDDVEEAEDGSELLDDAETESVESREDDVEPAAEPETVDTPNTEQDVQEEPQRKGGFAPAFFGGLVAAALGFAAGQAGVLDRFIGVDEPVVDYSADIQTLKDAQTALGDKHDQLATQLSQGSDTSEIAGELAEVSNNLSAAQTQISALAERVGGLEALSDRLTAIETRPVTDGASDEAIAAYEAELARVTEALAAQRQDIERMVAEARALDATSAEAARVATAQTALARLKIKLDNGEDFQDLVAELTALDVAVPETLTSAAGGVATLQALTAGFAPAARNALSVSRSETAGSGGISGYLRRYLNARSVTPREGDDPDAILSRAEASVRAGDIASALTEIEALPEAARAELSAWEAAARLRALASAAADELAQSLNTN